MVIDQQDPDAASLLFVSGFV
jgi:hypothetical protein